ncbi:tRNA (guanine-N(1)-)-methyltransferase, partial [Dissostichus eleginoides]
VVFLPVLCGCAVGEVAVSEPGHSCTPRGESLLLEPRCLFRFPPLRPDSLCSLFPFPLLQSSSKDSTVRVTDKPDNCVALDREREVEEESPMSGSSFGRASTAPQPSMWHLEPASNNTPHTIQSLRLSTGVTFQEISTDVGLRPQLSRRSKYLSTRELLLGDCIVIGTSVRVFALPVFVGVLRHTVVAVEVKEANEIDAVIGVVAPRGAAA